MKSLLNDLIHWLAKTFRTKRPVAAQQQAIYLAEAVSMQEAIRKWIGAEECEKIGLGQNCNASWYLKQTDNKRASYPFDWIYTTPEIIMHMLHDDFRQFLQRDLIIPHGLDAGHKVYHETLFGHRNLLRSDADYAYYVRSVDRWRRLMASHTPLVFVTVVLNETEKRKRWKEGFTKEFKLPRDQRLADFEPMMHYILLLNPNCKFLFIEQYTEGSFELKTIEKNEQVLWLKYGSVDSNTGVQYLNPMDDEVMKTIFTGLHS